jgi:hypothetical protein
MLFDRTQVASAHILFKIRLIISDLRTGNHTNTALLCNCPCKAKAADTNAHAALDNWNARRFILYF